MYNDKKNQEIARLNFEDLLWITYATMSLLNVYGDYWDKEYVKTDDSDFQVRSDKIFKMTLTVTLFIYTYFFIRNYNNYKNAPEEKKTVFMIRVFGSIFIIVGVICLLYFHFNYNKKTRE